ncbi:MAG TPA: AsmA-like C-terminal region-containing protein [Hyphomicrobiaceae bacterium]|nr:AsmA-like C-terminal region-containing protein [Hyphomicrobiaceae bacterium]
MRRNNVISRNVISRFATLSFATLACLLIAVLAPMLMGRRGSDEPFSGYSVMASPRDMHVIAAPIRLSAAPDLTISRGTLYADGNAAAGTPISRFVLDGPVLHLNASGLRTSPPGSDAAGPTGSIAPLLVEQLAAMGFDTLTLRRGTLHVTADNGSSETIGEIEAELSGGRKGNITARGSFSIRGQRLAFDASLPAHADKRTQRWPMKVAIKGDLLEALFDGHLSVAEDLRLAGQIELASSSLRRAARWFGVPLSPADGLNATQVKGQINWARHTLAVEGAKVVLDGNEGTGALAVNLKGERPLIDATLAFNALDLTPYAESARSQSFLFDRQTASWSAFDLSFPIIRHVDADLRISAPKVLIKGYGVALGGGAATITVRSGKLLADIADLDFQGGKVTAQITANANDPVPLYTLRGKVESFDAGAAGTALFGAPVLSGRSTLSVDVQGAGQTPAELLRTLSGKAAMSMAEGARLALDMKALRAAAKPNGPPGWGLLAKGQTSIEQVEARALIRDGTIVTEAVHARSGSAGVGASGRIDLVERTLDLRLFMKPSVPTDRPLKLADVVGADTVTVRGPWAEPFVRPEEATPDPATR